MAELYYGRNILITGPAGAGKSTLAASTFATDERYYERDVLLPNYNRDDLMGHYTPWMNGRAVEYRLQPGPFTRAWAHAMKDPAHMYYLILEDIHHADVTLAFGEVFSLLDRNNDGVSRYPVTMPMNLAQWAYLHVNKYQGKLYIPANLTIVATMTSFSGSSNREILGEFWRRWTVWNVGAKTSDDDFANEKILDTNVTWGAFVEWINQTIKTKSLYAEGKEIGMHFMSRYEFGPGSNEREFITKLIGYLWEALSSVERMDFFRDGSKSKEELIEEFVQKKGRARLEIFSRVFE